MRIARFEASDGRVYTGRLVDESHAQPVLDTAESRLEFAQEKIAIRRLLAPLTPVNIFCIGRNYAAHAEELGNAVPEAPLIFMKPTTAVIGPDEPILLPDSAPEQVDFEAELAIVIGRRARRVSPEAALEYVQGFTCANDVSARDCQKSDKQWARAKGFDAFCPLGPWIVTTDELDPASAVVRSRLNGQLMQESTTAKMLHDCRALISYLSHQFTLLPGTLILTGTPEGVGAGRNPPVFLKDGDRIEVEIEGIGKLSNPVVR